MNPVVERGLEALRERNRRGPAVRAEHSQAASASYGSPYPPIEPHRSDERPGPTPSPLESGETGDAHSTHGVALCGSPNCDGCYEVEPGRRIHPPKASPEWLEWLKKWEPKTKRSQ